MGKFKNKVAMLVTKGQFGELSDKMVEIGYKREGRTRYPDDPEYAKHFITNHWFGTGDIAFGVNAGNTRHLDGFVIIQDYNPDLFLALCAQSPDGGSFNNEEWVMLPGKGWHQVTSQSGITVRCGNHTERKAKAVRPTVEALTKHFTRKAVAAQAMEAIRNEIKHLRSSDHVHGILLHIPGRKPLEVLRVNGKVASNLAHVHERPVDFADAYWNATKQKTTGDIPPLQHVNSRCYIGSMEGTIEGEVLIKGEWVGIGEALKGVLGHSGDVINVSEDTSKDTLKPGSLPGLRKRLFALIILQSEIEKISNDAEKLSLPAVVQDANVMLAMVKLKIEKVRSILKSMDSKAMRDNVPPVVKGEKPVMDTFGRATKIKRGDIVLVLTDKWVEATYITS